MNGEEFTFSLKAIGVARTPYSEKSVAPRQPRAAEEQTAIIELYKGHGYEDALGDLEGWTACWILFWMHQADGWNAKVRPPRSTIKRGVFSTRAPHRPNPIGLSAVRIDRVEGRFLHVRDVDILDGTPILDIKPYVPWADAIPDAETGWLAEEGRRASLGQFGRPADPGPKWDVVLDEAAEAHLAYLDGMGLNIRERVLYQLSLGPAPHAYRRIKVFPNYLVLSVHAWRVRFVVEETRARVLLVESGLRTNKRLLDTEEAEQHRRYVSQFGAFNP